MKPRNSKAFTADWWKREEAYRIALGLKPGEDLPRAAGTLAGGNRSSRTRAAKSRRSRPPAGAQLS